MMIFVYSTFPNKTKANDLTKKLLAKKLIACANLFIIESMYPWQGKMVKGKEVAVFFKTEKRLVGQVEKFLLTYHPYKTPCVITIPISSVNKSYNQWLKLNLIK